MLCTYSQITIFRVPPGTTEENINEQSRYKSLDKAKQRKRTSMNNPDTKLLVNEEGERNYTMKNARDTIQ